MPELKYTNFQMILAALALTRSRIIGGPAATQIIALGRNRAFAALATNCQSPQTQVEHKSETPPLRALLLDAAGTLLSPSEPAALVIQRYARPYGCTLSELEILKNFRKCARPPLPTPDSPAIQMVPVFRDHIMRL